MTVHGGSRGAPVITVMSYIMSQLTPLGSQNHQRGTRLHPETLRLHPPSLILPGRPNQLMPPGSVPLGRWTTNGVSRNERRVGNTSPTRRWVWWAWWTLDVLVPRSQGPISTQRICSKHSGCGPLGSKYPPSASILNTPPASENAVDGPLPSPTAPRDTAGRT